MILIETSGNRYCKDGKFRSFASFGTFHECVKIYKCLGHAKRIAKRHNANIIVIPKGMSIDASGLIIETKNCEDKPGYVNYIHHNVSEFIVKE